MHNVRVHSSTARSIFANRTVRVEKIAPREPSSAKKHVKTKQIPEMRQTKSDLDEHQSGLEIFFSKYYDGVNDMA